MTDDFLSTLVQRENNPQDKRLKVRERFELGMVM
jgi:hypothetical protein